MRLRTSRYDQLKTLFDPLLIVASEKQNIPSYDLMLKVAPFIVEDAHGGTEAQLRAALFKVLEIVYKKRSEASVTPMRLWFRYVNHHHAQNDKMLIRTLLDVGLPKDVPVGDDHYNSLILLLLEAANETPVRKVFVLTQQTYIIHALTQDDDAEARQCFSRFSYYLYYQSHHNRGVNVRTMSADFFDVLLGDESLMTPEQKSRLEKRLPQWVCDVFPERYGQHFRSWNDIIVYMMTYAIPYNAAYHEALTERSFVCCYFESPAFLYIKKHLNTMELKSMDTVIECIKVVFLSMQDWVGDDEAMLESLLMNLYSELEKGTTPLGKKNVQRLESKLVVTQLMHDVEEHYNAFFIRFLTIWRFARHYIGYSRLGDYMKAFKTSTIEDSIFSMAFSYVDALKRPKRGVSQWCDDATEVLDQLIDVIQAVWYGKDLLNAMLRIRVLFDEERYPELHHSPRYQSLGWTLSRSPSVIQRITPHVTEVLASALCEIIDLKHISMLPDKDKAFIRAYSGDTCLPEIELLISRPYVR